MSKLRKPKNDQLSEASGHLVGTPTIEFGQPAERLFFTNQYQTFFELVTNSSKALDSVFKQSVPDNREGLTVFMLGKLCVDDFNEIVLLCGNGFGFGALKILRGMFEKVVDAKYLHIHPEEIDNFWDFYIVHLQKYGLDRVMKKTDTNWQNTVNKFKTRKRKSGSNRTQSSWTLKNLIDRAMEVGLNEHITSAYYLPTEFIHTSVIQILSNLRVEPDGTITQENHSLETNRNMADVALHMSYFLLLVVLETLIDHYKFDLAAPIVQRSADDYANYLKSL
jgi:hypothetical protein